VTPSQYQRVEELFEHACTLPASRRIAFLNELCADDPEVRQKVERMLAKDTDGAEHFESPAMGRGFHVGDPEEIERRLREEFESSGRYRLAEPIGEGGFGTVYRAEQLHPVQRTVALKVVKLGMDTRRLIARFEAERQTLALMEHPAIAHVYDAGATASGRPYFAMELVSGAPITRYCDEHKLSVRQRLELFLKVAAAVQHAHQKGVMHRDIKPSNVLVTIYDDSALPKLIDFGIASAVNDSLSGQTIMTEQGQIIGTPEYMSPEQADGGGDVDTRTDIYALGVLLYELLTGAMPFDRDALCGLGPIELVRQIREKDPPTPSTRVKACGADGVVTAERRGTDPTTLGRTMRGDLDCIIMKAIEKDRTRRYETVEAFASDIFRYLHEEPILARPPSASYRFKKFARRNKGALAAGVTISLVLVGGVIGTAIGMVRAQNEAAIARSESAIARAVTNFLNDDLVAAVAPDQLGNDASMREVVEAAAKRVKGRFDGQPLVEAAIRLSLGRTFAKLSNLPAAEQNLDRALELRRKELGTEAGETLDVAYELALVYKLQDRNPEAEQLLQTVLDGRLRLLGEHHADTISTLYELSVAIGEQGRYDETESMMMKALDLARQDMGDDHILTLRIVRGVGVLFASQDQAARAETYFEEAHRISSTTLGADHPLTLLATQNLAASRILAGRFQEAELLLTNGLSVSKRIRGEEHPATLLMMTLLARTWHSLKRIEDAEALYRSALDTAMRTLPEGHTVTSDMQSTLAHMYDDLKRFSDAEPLYLQCIAARERTLGPTHPLTLEAVRGVVSHYEASGEAERAAPWLQRLHSAEAATPDGDEGHTHHESRS
jgi:non-specific serine/threonine protein kinase/serine/threonine-protein kinase